MKTKPEVLILIIAALALAAKIYCAATTYGTTDTGLFASFGHSIAEKGLIHLYASEELFNHPPLVGNYLGLIFTAANGSPHTFDFLLRLPGILADAAVVVLMLWVCRRTARPPWWGLSLLAASPVCFMISGYHGNDDSLIPLGLLLAVVASMQERALLAGVMLGLACQIKIIPLMMGPVLFFYWLNRGKGWRFATATAATLLVGWSAPLLTVPGSYIKRVLAYDSVWGWWGIPYLLSRSELPGMSGFLMLRARTPAQLIIANALKGLVIAGALWIAWRRRKGSAASMLGTMGLIWAVFFTFAPGFGAQYLAWVSPFLLYYSPRWFAAFTGAASLSLFIFYDTISRGMPWAQGYGLSELAHIWVPWMLIPWAVFLATVIASHRDLFGTLPEKAAT